MQACRAAGGRVAAKPVHDTVEHVGAPAARGQARPPRRERNAAVRHEGLGAAEFVRPDVYWTTDRGRMYTACARAHASTHHGWARQTGRTATVQVASAAVLRRRGAAWEKGGLQKLTSPTHGCRNASTASHSWSRSRLLYRGSCVFSRAAKQSIAHGPHAASRTANAAGHNRQAVRPMWRNRRSAATLASDGDQVAVTRKPRAPSTSCKRCTSAINAGERKHMALRAPIVTRESVRTSNTEPGEKRRENDCTAYRTATNSLRLMWASARDRRKKPRARKSRRKVAPQP